MGSVIRLTLLSLLFLSPVIQARCLEAGNQIISVSVANLVVGAHVPIGGLIATQWVDTDKLFVSQCEGNAQYNATMLGAYSTKNELLNGVYNTGVPGIGVTISDLLDEQQNTPNRKDLLLRSPGLKAKKLRISFYKTGQIKAGRLPAGNLATFSLSYANNAAEPLYHLQLVGGIIQSESCYASAQHIRVELGKYSKNSFQEIGSSTTPKAFNVELICPSVQTPVWVSFEPNSGVLPLMAGVIPLDNQPNSAQGVGVRILDTAANPLIFSEKKKHYSDAQQRVIIPLQASFVKTATKVMSGDTQASLTFVITQN